MRSSNLRGKCVYNIVYIINISYIYIDSVLFVHGYHLNIADSDNRVYSCYNDSIGRGSPGISVHKYKLRSGRYIVLWGMGVLAAMRS